MAATYTLVDLETWPRKEHREHFSTAAKCFISTTKKMDVTALHAATHASGERFYVAVLYVVSSVINRHREFKLSWQPKERRLIVWDEVSPSHLVFHKDDETFTCIWSRWTADFAAFSRGCREDMAEGLRHRGYRVPGIPENVFSASCLPWLGYDALHLSLNGDEPYLAPIVTWGKAERIGERLQMPLSFEIHHGAADGFHIARFYEEVAQEMEALAARLRA